MESLIGTAIAVGIGLCIVALGIWQMVTGNPRLLHSYHYATTPAADLPRLAFCEGLCMVGLGVSIFLCVFAAAGLTQRAPRPRWAIAIEVAGIVLFAVSLAALLLFIPYFGGSLNP